MENKYKITNYLKIKSFTYNIDNLDIFDFKHSDYLIVNYNINQSVKFFILNYNIFYLQNFIYYSIPNNNTYLLMSIKKESELLGNYWIEIPEFINNNIPIPLTYLIVKPIIFDNLISENGYEIDIGNIIKLGRVELKVVEIKINTSSCKIIKKYDQYLEKDIFYICQNQNKIIKNNCRYCLKKNIFGDYFENLIIYPCNCKGSIGAIHFLCLKKWIQYKIIYKNDKNIINYHLTKIKCEICKKNWPKYIKFNGEVRDLINIIKPDTSYIIMKNKRNQKEYYFLIKMKENDIVKIGRSSQSDLKLNITSLSKIHSYLKFYNNKFIIFDNKSKYGTLILLNKNYQIRDSEISVLINKTVFKIKLKYK